MVAESRLGLGRGHLHWAISQTLGIDLAWNGWHAWLVQQDCDIEDIGQVGSRRWS